MLLFKAMSTLSLQKCVCARFELMTDKFNESTAVKPPKDPWQIIPLDIGSQKVTIHHEPVHQSWVCKDVICPNITCPAETFSAIPTQECCARCSAPENYCKQFESQASD